MKNHRVSVWLSMLAVVLAVACFAMAAHFNGQYVSARRAASRALHEARSYGKVPVASVTSRTLPDKYILRAWWMFYASVAVWVFAVVITVKARHWVNWLAMLMVAVISLCIPLVLLLVI